MPVIILLPVAPRVLMASGTTVAPPDAVIADDVTIFCVVSSWPPVIPPCDTSICAPDAAFEDRFVAVIVAVETEGDEFPAPPPTPTTPLVKTDDEADEDEGNLPMPTCVIVKEGCCTLAAIVTGGRIPIFPVADVLTIIGCSITLPAKRPADPIICCVVAEPGCCCNCMMRAGKLVDDIC